MLKRKMLGFLAIALLLNTPAMVFGAKGKGEPKAPPPKRGAGGPPKSGEELINSIKDEINRTPKDADVKLFKMVGDFLGKVKLPSVANKMFNKNLAMRNMKILTDIPKAKFIRSGIGFTGSMFINKLQVVGTMYVLLDSSMRPQFSLSVELPKNYKISELFPRFKKLDVLSLPKPKYLFTTIDYTDKDGTLMKQGLNFLATLDLSGPLDVLRSIKEQAKKLDSIIIKDEPVRFTGHIPYNVMNAKFGAVIPIRFGIDFTKIKKLPKSITDIFKEFTSDDFEFDIQLPKFVMTIEAGVRLVLGTQKDPIRLSSIAVIEPVTKKISLGMRMRNKLELKWISFGNAGIQIDFDKDLMNLTSAIGIPFTGLGAYGEISVGKEGKSRATFKGTAAVEVSKDKIPPLIWELEATNIRFEDIVELLIKIARKKKGLKKPFPSDKIPTMRINKARGYLATEEKTIAKKLYKAGIGLTFDAQFFNQKVLLDIEILHKELKMDGVGYLSNVEIKNKKGKSLFSLTGPGPDQKYDTKDDGPIAFCSFDIKHPLDAAFGVRGKVKIPPLKIEAKTDLVMTGKSFKADMETKFAGFTGIFQVNIDPLKMKEMFVRIGFKKDFDQFLMNVLKQKLAEFKKKLMARLDKLNKKVGDISKKVGDFGKKAKGAVDKEAREAKAEIKALEAKYADLDKKFKAADNNFKAADRNVKKAKIGKAKREARKKKQDARKKKRDARAARNKVGVQLTAKRAYLKLILKPGQKVTTGAAVTLDKATKALAAARLLQKAATKVLNGITKAIDGVAKGMRLIQVKEAIGSYSMPEMLAGKSPKLEKLVIKTEFPGREPKTISLKDVQFDFGKPVKAAGDIIKKTLKKVGIDIEKFKEKRAKRKAKRKVKRAKRKVKRGKKKEVRKGKTAKRKEKRGKKKTKRKEKRKSKKAKRKKRRK